MLCLQTRISSKVDPLPTVLSHYYDSEQCTSCIYFDLSVKSYTASLGGVFLSALPAQKGFVI
ncbi:hypothetical protein VAZ01S_025_00240 [Vibrio azureus NBRC 104587]|uniref:Uncharacterized protein n=1 Tax=Vibrio azureus NBRC 104587 TaxID=1219077 RepID=U3ANS8_9VIBR|nr:hypothetical protein VAZ01S_025_00240 [Vibrio azureus NBRC 104587]